VYRRLLIPVDQPAEVEPLIRFGSMMLDADGEIRVLHVVRATSLPEVTRKWRASVNIVVPAHEAGAALDVRVDPEVRAAADVSGEILESAETHSVDAILMTLRGDKRSRNPLVGRTSSVVLRHATCDVVIVNRLALVTERVGRILVPTFGPTPSAKAMRLAEELAVRHQGVPIVGLTVSAREEDIVQGWHPPARSSRGVTIEQKRSVVSGTILGRRRRLPELILAAAARERYGILLLAEDPHHAEGPLLTRRILEELFRAAPCPVVALRG
jgi:nucleotide-binding universal stress UspA family protein